MIGFDRDICTNGRSALLRWLLNSRPKYSTYPLSRKEAGMQGHRLFLLHPIAIGIVALMKFEAQSKI